MGKSFLPGVVDQTWLFPPSLHDWLPEGHLARSLVDVVAALDLSAIYASYEEKDGRGQSAYAPEMMWRVLLYGYATGVYSSRKIEARTYEDVAFRYLSGTSTRTTTRLRSSASGLRRAKSPLTAKDKQRTAPSVATALPMGHPQGCSLGDKSNLRKLCARQTL